MVLNVSVKKIICSVLEFVDLVLILLVLIQKEQPASVKILNKSMILLKQFVFHFLLIVLSMMITLIVLVYLDTKKKMELVLTLALVVLLLMLLVNVSVVEDFILKEMFARNQFNAHLDLLGIPRP